MYLPTSGCRCRALPTPARGVAGWSCWPWSCCDPGSRPCRGPPPGCSRSSPPPANMRAVIDEWRYPDITILNSILTNQLFCSSSKWSHISVAASYNAYKSHLHGVVHYVHRWVPHVHGGVQHHLHAVVTCHVQHPLTLTLNCLWINIFSPVKIFSAVPVSRAQAPWTRAWRGEGPR